MSIEEPCQEGALPADVADILRQLDLNEREAEALMRDLGEEQVSWRPAPTAWSIGHCLDHLTRANLVYCTPMRQAAAAARRRGAMRRGPIWPGAPSRWFLRTLEPPPRRRLRSPRQIAPAPVAAKAQLAGDFRDSQQEVRDFLRQAADLDLDGVRFVNPFLPLVRFTLGTGFLVIASHQRRHLWQAGRVRQLPGFP